jgi:HK97 family phage prohead protease
MKSEERRISVAKIEIRATDDDDESIGSVEGIAAPFNSLSEDLGGFRERIAKGAFTDTLRDNDQAAFWSHDQSIVLGKRSADTLSLRETDDGLKFSLKLPDTQAGRDAKVSITRGDVTQMSFGFAVDHREDSPGDEWEMMDDDVVRTLLRVRLFEVSPVAFPAYPETSVAKRSLDQFIQESQYTGAPIAKRFMRLEVAKRA